MTRLQVVVLTIVCGVFVGCREESTPFVADRSNPEGVSFSRPVVMDFPINLDGARNRMVPMAIHLPEGEGANPLVLVSHGAAGSRDGLYALATEIASRGYVVLCLEHVTSNLDSIRHRMRSKRLGFKDAIIDSGNDLQARKNRPLDVRFAIDFAEHLNREEERLKGRIDLSHIAIVGHSYGAYTAMVCSGVKPVNIEEDLSEPRIRVAIALSPQSASGVFFDKQSFAKVDRPFVGISGTRDKTSDTASSDERRDFFDLMPKGDKHLIWFHDAGHFSFSDPTGSGRKTLLAPDRDVTYALKVLVPAILDFYLGGKPELEKSSRDDLVQKSLGGSVRKILWETK